MRKTTHNLIRLLLSDKLNWSGKRKLSESEPMENLMRKQWEVCDSPDDIVVKERIFAGILSKCNQLNKRPSHKVQWSVVAASVAIIVLVGSLWFTQQNQAIEYVEFTANDNTLYQLPDSSKVWMQPGSSIRYSKQFLSNRRVEMKGDLIFEVRKRRSSTFRVFIDKAFVEVTGTCFRIKENHLSKSEVTLFHGEVKFHTEENKETIAMHPRQKITYDHLTKQVTLQNTENIDFQSEKYKFTEIRLDTLVNTINEMYGSKIMIDKRVDLNYFFSGYIRYNEPLESVIEKMCFNMSVRYKKVNEEIIIYK